MTDSVNIEVFHLMFWHILGSFFVIYAFLDLFDKDTGLKHPLTVETTAMAVDRIFPELTGSDKQDVINHVNKPDIPKSEGKMDCWIILPVI